MCGIIAYISSNQKKRKENSCVTACLEGLKLLEYRGYDSSGIAGIIDGKIKSCKRAGKVNTLVAAVNSKKLRLDIAIAHTRWATHGPPTQKNAHPHFDQKRSLAIVHNGIIENHNTLRDKLKERGVLFQSETDSEVIAQLISHHYCGNLKAALQKSMKELQGSLAIALIHEQHPNQIFAACRESPLVLGLNEKNQEAYLASDANSFCGKSLDILYLSNDELAILSDDKIEVFDSHGMAVTKQREKVAFKSAPISKNGFKHFMLKEISEQPQTIQQAMQGRCREEFGTAEFEELNLNLEELRSINRICILGCGTSWHAGNIAVTMLENIARIPAQSEIASEFRYKNPIISENTLVIAISQSGETADTIAAVREAKIKGAKVIAICNVNHSTLAREANSCLFLRAGPEISVVSTKAFTSQLTVIALFSLFMARIRHMDKEKGQHFLKELKQLPTKITQVLSQFSTIQSFAKKYGSFEDFFFIGRHYMYPASQEAALKLKEISYLNACAYPAAELKHGPIALISLQLATIALCGNLQTFDKMLSNLMEIKARGGPILAFAPKGKEEIKYITEDIIWIPKISDILAPILYSVGTQIFAYSIATIRGTDIDQPRNLAKSVTVE